MAAPLRVRVRHTPRAGAAAAGGGVGVACRVCGRAGHAAGFIGAVYYDCPNLACYLCKGAGHTTASCPHRAYETAVPTVAAAGGPPTAAAAGGPPPPQPSRLQALAARAAGALRGPAALAALRASCGAARVLAAHAAAAAGSACGCGARACASLAAPWRVGAAAHRLHARRVSVLAWHPDPAMAGLLASGDKSGELGVWRVLGDGGGGGMARRSVYAGHAYLINALEWAAGNGAVSSLRAFTASSDGTLRLQHVERQASDDLATANAGWAGGPETAWRMFYSLARGRSGGGEDDPLLWAGDDAGRLWCVDVRAGGAVARVQAHRAKSKILSLSVHPTDPHTLASAGGDWSVKLWDLRALRPAPGAARLGDAAPAPAAQPLVTLPHGRAVSAAAFSPQTGSRLLTTCGDNRLRIWDDTGALLAAATDPAIDARRLEPDITIVHSHDFARYLAPARAVWDAKDASEATLLCGRYISRPCDLGTLRADVGAPVSSCGRLAARAEPAAGSDHVVALHPIDVYEAPAGRGCNALCVRAAAAGDETAAAASAEASPSSGGGGDAASDGGGGGSDSEGLSSEDSGSDDAASGGGLARARGGLRRPARVLAPPPPMRTHAFAAPTTLVGQLLDPLNELISPIVAVHPSLHMVATASSQSVYAWVPAAAFSCLPAAAAAAAAAGDAGEGGAERLMARVFSLRNPALRHGYYVGCANDDERTGTRSRFLSGAAAVTTAAGPALSRQPVRSSRGRAALAAAATAAASVASPHAFLLRGPDDVLGVSAIMEAADGSVAVPSARAAARHASAGAGAGAGAAADGGGSARATATGTKRKRGRSEGATCTAAASSSVSPFFIASAAVAAPGAAAAATSADAPPSPIARSRALASAAPASPASTSIYFSRPSSPPPGGAPPPSPPLLLPPRILGASDRLLVRAAAATTAPAALPLAMVAPAPAPVAPPQPPPAARARFGGED